MLTERQKQLIEAYLPNPRDPELDDDEYYALDTADRVRKVYIRDIFLDGDGRDTYGVRDVKSGLRVDAGYGDPFKGFYKHHLYDNKEDCKNHAHLGYDAWEELRELQLKEQGGKENE